MMKDEHHQHCVVDDCVGVHGGVGGFGGGATFGRIRRVTDLLMLVCCCCCCCTEVSMCLYTGSGEDSSSYGGGNVDGCNLIFGIFEADRDR